MSSFTEGSPIASREFSPSLSDNDTCPSSPFTSPAASVDLLDAASSKTLLLTSTSSRPQCDSIIFDLGDVLFTWSSDTNTPISPKTLHKILRSATWFEYEKGNLEEDECYALVAQEFSLETSDVAAAFRAARDSLQGNPAMIQLLHELKATANVRIFAMSNISAPDFEVLRHKGRPEDWALFERVFTSADARERKPNLGYYRYVLEATGVDPRRTAFVDDKLENVVTAKSLGLRGLVFTSFADVARELRALVRDPVADGEAYLRKNAKQMKSVTDSGVILEENFGQLLILEATNDPSLVDYIKYPRLTNFFKGGGVLTTTAFPYDLDSTSIACTVSGHMTSDVKNDIMDEILTLRNRDGIVQTYFDRTRPRIDPVVCVNVLTLFHSCGRGHELAETFNWVYDVLKNRAFADGTLYYCGPDTFFYFLSRLLSVSIAARKRFGPVLARRIAEYFGAPGDALALAMRVYAAAAVDLCDTRDYDRLLAMQEADGSWPMGWIYKYGSTDILIGNTGLTTAIAVAAVKKYRELEEALRSFD